MAELAHAGHWLVNAAYLAPVVGFLGWLGWMTWKERRRAASADGLRYPRRTPAGVAQLVRAPACHAGGRRFESGRSRQTPSSSDAIWAPLIRFVIFCIATSRA